MSNILSNMLFLDLASLFLFNNDSFTLNQSQRDFKRAWSLTKPVLVAVEASQRAAYGNRDGAALLRVQKNCFPSSHLLICCETTNLGNARSIIQLWIVPTELFLSNKNSPAQKISPVPLRLWSALACTSEMVVRWSPKMAMRVHGNMKETLWWKLLFLT